MFRRCVDCKWFRNYNTSLPGGKLCYCKAFGPKEVKQEYRFNSCKEFTNEEKMIIRYKVDNVILEDLLPVPKAWRDNLYLVSDFDIMTYFLNLKDYTLEVFLPERIIINFYSRFSAYYEGALITELNRILPFEVSSIVERNKKKVFTYKRR